MMTEYRYTLSAERPDGGVAALAMFKVKDLALVTLKSAREQFPEYAFEVEDTHKEISTSEFLSDDNNFD